MREIKFRVWEKHAKRMAEVTAFKWQPDHLYHQVYTRAIVNQKMIDEWYAYDFGGDSNGIILMQYTGLKDKNGKEIYEGDILGVISACSTYLIEWNKEYGCYTSINTATENYDGDILEQIAFYLLSNMRLDICEIIGNIHENPELLEAHHE